LKKVNFPVRLHAISNESICFKGIRASWSINVRQIDYFLFVFNISFIQVQTQWNIDFSSQFDQD